MWIINNKFDGTLQAQINSWILNCSGGHETERKIYSERQNFGFMLRIAKVCENKRIHE